MLGFPFPASLFGGADGCKRRYYVPAIGFLMFAVGLNLKEKDFVEAFRRPAPIFAGYFGQYVLKPFLGFLFGTLSMTLLGLPASLSVDLFSQSYRSGFENLFHMNKVIS